MSAPDFIILGQEDGVYLIVHPCFHQRRDSRLDSLSYRAHVFSSTVRQRLEAYGRFCICAFWEPGIDEVRSVFRGSV
jgi:hypothetical protein